jgi:hypothetical protein
MEEKIYDINKDMDCISLEELDSAIMSLFQRIVEHDATEEEIQFAKNIKTDLEEIFWEG